ncbi:PaaI family thioesterase [Bordetella parapertussis]|uniref:Thioesterase domain-containing protein n=7 Tax=Bordetella TaxID=517 RepID=K0MIV8_BORPB|nr:MULTISPECIES: PaaI family thioesterase [Bordetella]AMG88945.2 PaaI family thioesterase [Bordetella bronchiseptica]AUL43817.1 thioesterase [Bordetella parapertussis]AWP62669.1 thioesterase [Bordetella parapertussis]AWP70167.1 thioesterase [Bordetella parapertussis]AWP75235.1 thioesterase [Bordetella bronchiseptica]
MAFLQPSLFMNDSIPDGFAPWRPGSPFMAHLADLGTFYVREADDALAVRVGPPHTNMHGIAHGGLLATLADSALGYCISRRAQASVVTVQMSVEYLSAVKPGDWLQAQVRIDKQGRRLIYATCLLQVEDRLMLKANAVFAVRAAPAPVSDG